MGFRGFLLSPLFPSTSGQEYHVGGGSSEGFRGLGFGALGSLRGGSSSRKRLGSSIKVEV